MRQRAVRVHDCALYIASGHHRLTSATLRATLITPRAGDFWPSMQEKYYLGNPDNTCSRPSVMYLLADLG